MSTDALVPSGPMALEDDKIQAIYEDLDTMNVALDDDPIAFGPKRLNGKIAEVRRALSRCERLFLSVSQMLAGLKRARLKAQGDLKLSMDDLFANDPETRSGRNVSDREAIAKVKLRAQVREISRLDLAVHDLDAVMVVIKSKRADLKDTHGRLRDQVRLCQEELGLGSKWGSRRPDATPAVPGRVLALASDSSAIDEILGSMDEDIAESQASGSWDAGMADLRAARPSMSDLAQASETAVLPGHAPTPVDQPIVQALPLFAPPAVCAPVLDTASLDDVDAFLDAPDETPVQYEISDEELDRLLNNA